MTDQANSQYDRRTPIIRRLQKQLPSRKPAARLSQFCSNVAFTTGDPHFGEIRQVAYLVKDIEQAMRHWTGVLGIGPFFYVEKRTAHGSTYRGQPSAPQLSLAMSQSGPLQIELIQQHNDAPSQFLDYVKAGFEGQHHIAFWTKQFDADMARYPRHGERRKRERFQIRRILPGFCTIGRIVLPECPSGAPLRPCLISIQIYFPADQSALRSTVPASTAALNFRICSSCPSWVCLETCTSQYSTQGSNSRS